MTETATMTQSPAMTETATKWVLIAPHDSLFFRDGRPFNLDDQGAALAASSFPPPPRTIAQMIRAALAAGRGWTGGNWCAGQGGEVFRSVLGDGPDDLGELRFAPPRLVEMGTKSLTPLYPAPLGVVIRLSADGTRVADVARLSPTASRHCDLGQVLLPEVEGEGWKAPEGWYLTADGLADFLAGKTPKSTEFRRLAALAPSESRVGIRRDRGTRQVEQGMLYMTVHRRPGTGLSSHSREIRLCAGYSGAEEWEPAAVRPFGGEHRFAWLDIAQDMPTLPEVELPSEGAELRYTVTLLSPLLPTDDGWRTPGGRLEGLPGSIVSACVGKPQMIGGWSSFAKFGPQALKPHLPAGSIWFIKANSSDVNLADLPPALGQATEFGYGGVVYGRWQER